MVWRKPVKKEKKEKIIKVEEVVIEKIEKPVQAICKSAGCNSYAVTEGVCQHCYNNLHTVGYK